MLYLAGASGIHLNSPWAGYFAENLSSRRLPISHYSLEYFRPIKILIADPAKHLVPPAQKHFASCLQYSDRSLLAETFRADIFLSEWLYFRLQRSKSPPPVVTLSLPGELGLISYGHMRKPTASSIGTALLLRRCRRAYRRSCAAPAPLRIRQYAPFAALGSPPPRLRRRRITPTAVPLVPLVPLLRCAKYGRNASNLLSSPEASPERDWPGILKYELV